MSLARIEKTLLFLVILFLPTQPGKHFWPLFSFVYSLPVDYLSPTIYFWDLLVLLLCLFFILNKGYINRLALNLYFFFILTQTLSLVSQSANIGAGLVRLEQYFIAGLFGIYIASSKKTQTSHAIFWGLLLSIIGESILAILQFLKSGTIGLWFLGERTFSISTPGIAKFDYFGLEFLRPYATFPHPNVLAGFLVIVMLLLVLGKNFRFKLSYLAIFLGGLAILLTVSRTAIIAGFISLMVLSKKKARVLLLLATIVLLPILFTRFSSLINYDNLTFLRREQLSKIAATSWSTSPILGVGLNNFIPAAADLLLAGPSRFLQPVHNIFLLSLSETGIAGFIGLVVLMGYPIFKSFHLPLILLAWGVIIFLGMFDHYFLTLPQGYRLLFFVWGLSMAMLE